MVSCTLIKHVYEHNKNLQDFLAAAVHKVIFISLQFREPVICTLAALTALHCVTLDWRPNGKRIQTRQNATIPHKARVFHCHNEKLICKKKQASGLKSNWRETCTTDAHFYRKLVDGPTLFWTFNVLARYRKQIKQSNAEIESDILIFNT